MEAMGSMTEEIGAYLSAILVLGFGLAAWLAC
jgi:hypothetical protein